MRLFQVVLVGLCFGQFFSCVVLAKTTQDVETRQQAIVSSNLCKQLYQQPSRKAFDACRLAIKKEPLGEENWQRWGQLHYRAGSYGKAQRYFSRALLLARDFGNSTAIALALNGLARTHRAKGALDEAVKTYQSSLGHCQTDRKCIAGNHDGLGYIHLKQRRFEKAGSFFASCLENAGPIKNLKLLASCKYGLATVHFQKGEVRKASNFCAESLKLYEAASNKRGMAAALGCMASTAKKLHMGKQKWCAYKTKRARFYRELGEIKKSFILERGIARSKCSDG